MEQRHPEELGFSEVRLDQIARVADDFIDRGEIAGVVAGIVRDGALAYLDAFGKASISPERPMTTDSLFRIYSMTKPITTAAAMLLVERARIRLDDPLSLFFPEFSDMVVYTDGDSAPFATVPAERPILIRDLLTHSSGLAYGIGDEHPIDREYERVVWPVLNGDPNATLEQFARAVASVPLAHQPGTAWRYSVGCDIAAAIVERVTGTAFDEFVRAELFDPIGMNETWFTVPETERDRLAEVYTPGESGLVIAPDPPIMAYTSPRRHPNGGGGLVSSTLDYLRFCQFLLDDGRVGTTALLAPHTVEMMMTNHLPAGLPGWDRAGSGFGYGGQVVTDAGLFAEYASQGRYSWGGAASTLFWVDPAERFAAVVMLQRVPGFSSKVTADLTTTIYQALVE